MYSHQESGYSAHSAAEALASALKAATAQKDEALSIHVFVVSLIKTHTGWKAVTDVVVEPKPGDKLEKPKSGPHPSYPGEEDPQEKKKKLKEQLEKEHQQEEKIHQEIEEHNLDEKLLKETAAIAEKEDDAATHLYAEMYIEEAFLLIEPGLHFDYVHFLPDGSSLWEEAKLHQPDLELYEASLPAESRPDVMQPAPAPSAPEPVTETEDPEPAEE